MIIWNCAFNIPDSTMQVAEAYVRVVNYKNINAKAAVDVIVTGDTDDVIIKEYRQTFERNFNNEDEIYEELLPDYQPGTIIYS